MRWVGVGSPSRSPVARSASTTAARAAYMVRPASSSYRARPPSVVIHSGVSGSILPSRAITDRDGRMLPETPEWITTEDGRARYDELAGRAQRVDDGGPRRVHGAPGEPTPTQRMTNFYERGDKPLEIVTSRQWYIRNGGRDWADRDLRAELLGRGQELAFHPDFMRVRYENWVGGLNGDWLISRQRFFGVALPLWYPVTAGGIDYDHPIVPDESSLPVDPSSDVAQVS